jgi:hypothetical protein
MAKSKWRAPARQAQTHPHDFDPIRIVPLHLPGAMAAAAAAQLTYRKGPLISAVEVFTIFWGTAWNQASTSPLIGQLNGFFDFILTSVIRTFTHRRIRGRSRRVTR